jgi:hypothetical protein
MANQTPENGGFQFRSGFVVDRHDRGSRVGEHDPEKWADFPKDHAQNMNPSILASGGNLSQILPYLRAKEGISDGVLVSHSAGNALPAVDRSGRVTRNRQSFDIASLHDCKRFSPLDLPHRSHDRRPDADARIGGDVRVEQSGGG